MFAVEIYAAVRDFVFNQEKSRREAARVFGLSRETVAKMCRFSLPPGYTRTKPVEKPKLGPLLPVIDAIAERLDAHGDGQRAAAVELALEGLYLAKRIDKSSDEGETVYG